jgi:hypothetical protein
MALTKASYSMITGAVANILDYGAVSDYNEVSGTGTDNSAAIQAAISDIQARGFGDGAIYIPAGRYKIETAIDVPYGVSIYGDGATASLIYAADCDGLNFVTYGYAIGSMFYEDFGITSAGGLNRVAVVTLPNASTMDGLYFNRMRFYGFNAAISFASNWNCTIQNCVMAEVNVGIGLSSGNGETIGIRILNNRITRSVGGTGTSLPVGIEINGTTKFNEAIYIAFNQIFGFATNIKIAQALFVNVFANDLAGTGNVIEFVTPNGNYNITNNFIEVRGSGNGIVGAPQGSPTPDTRSIIANNRFVGLDTAQRGLIMGGVGGQQYNGVIRDNSFGGFALNDIQIPNASGSTLIDNNRCMSTAPTNSIFIAGVLEPLVIVTNNRFKKAVVFDLPADYTSGKLIYVNNVENDTFQATKQSAVPTTGTWRVTDVVMNSAPTTGSPAGWVCTVAGTPGTWKPMANLA